MARRVSVRVEVHIAGTVYSRIRFKPEEISESRLREIRRTVIGAAKYAERVNRENIGGYRTLPIPKETK